MRMSYLSLLLPILTGCQSLDLPKAGALLDGSDSGTTTTDSPEDDTGGMDDGDAPDDDGEDSGLDGDGQDEDPQPLTIFEPSGEFDGGLTNVSSDVLQILEGGSLAGACDQWRLDPSDPVLELRCGKWMFFYETFGTEGVPVGFVDILLSGFSAEVGHGFSAYGMIPDPTSEKGYPLGMVEGTNGVAFTCASCHFGSLPDGRYAVGAANHSYEYGQHNLALAVFPLAAMAGITGMEVDTVAQEKVQPLLDHLASDVWLQMQFMGVLIGLIGVEIPSFPAEIQRHYAEWLPGTMDFFIAPLPIDDGVHTVSKISSLFGIPTDAEQHNFGMDHAMLGWTGNTRTLESFVGLFDALGGGDGANWSPEQLRPLATYVRSLHAPAPLSLPSEDALARGEKVFVDAGCLECHAGPRGSGLTLYDYDEVGTDDAMAYWMDPDGDGIACCGVDMGEDEVTNQVKAPRLTGLWAMSRFLHNGSVGSLEELLCLDGPRVLDTRPVFGNGGHTYGCDSLSVDEKQDLIDYLNAH